MLSEGEATASGTALPDWFGRTGLVLSSMIAQPFLALVRNQSGWPMISETDETIPVPYVSGVLTSFENVVLS